jgi:hypothetical protein
MTEETLEPLNTGTRYLKFTTEKAAMKALAPFFHQETETDEEGNAQPVGDPVLIQYSRNHCIDLVGALSKPTGKLLEDDVPEMTPIPGYHVNIRALTRVYEAEITALSDTHGVEVANPQRKWL